MKKLLSFLLCAALCLSLVVSDVFSVKANAQSEVELLKTALSHLKDKVDELEEQLEGMDHSNATFKVENGKLYVSYDSGASWTSLGTVKGADGADGKDGINGKDGADGKDGIDGKDGADGLNGANGVDGKDGADGKDGVDGKDGITPWLRIDSDSGNWMVSLDEGITWKDLGVAAQGPAGADGKDGADGADGRDGITPQMRINSTTKNWEISYDEGATWTVAGPATEAAAARNDLWLIPLAVACVSLVGVVVLLALYLQERRKAKPRNNAS